MLILTLAYWMIYLGAHVTSFTRMEIYIAHSNYTEGRCSNAHRILTLSSIITCSFHCFKDDACVAFYLESSVCSLYKISSLEFLETETNVKCFIAENLNKENLGDTLTNIQKANQTTTYVPFNPGSYSYQYAHKADSMIYCPDGSVLSGVGYCADEDAICEGVCAILNRETDAEYETSYAEQLTNCNFGDPAIAMDPFDAIVGKGYVKYCVILQNGWKVDETTSLTVTPRSDPPTMKISGVQLSNPSEWLLCSESSSPRYSINNLRMGTSFALKNILCYRIYY